MSASVITKKTVAKILNKIIIENIFSFFRINDLNIYKFSLKFSLNLLVNHQERKIFIHCLFKNNVIDSDRHVSLLPVYVCIYFSCAGSPLLCGEEPELPSHYGAQASHHCGFSGRGAGALDMWVSAAVAHGLQ